MADILIIGGGVSGLSAGIFSLLAGHSVTICEKNAFAGGNLTAWERDGCRIDNCIHWLSGTNPASPTYKLWHELGVLDLPIRYGESLYTCEYDGQRLSLGNDLHRLEAELLALSPEDEKEIRSLIEAVKAMQRLNGTAGDDRENRKGFPQSVFSLPKLYKYYRLTAGELAARFRHPLIRRFLSSFLTEDFGSLALVFVFADFCGRNAGIPAGGSAAMAERMAARFTSHGGKLLTGKEAVRLNTKGAKAVSVRFADGTELSAGNFIFTCDPASVFGRIIDRPMPQQLVRLYNDPRLVRFSSWHCAFRCTSPDLPFKGDFLLPAEGELRSECSSGYVALREFSHEPDFAPPGQSVFLAMAFLDEKRAREFIRLRSDRAAYAAKKERLTRLTEAAATKQFPELSGKLHPIDAWTPASYSRYFNAPGGSYMSFAFSSRILPRQVSGRIPGLLNVRLATQWQQAPGGLPIAAAAGKRAAEAVTRAERLKNRLPKIGQRGRLHGQRPVPERL